VKRDQRLHGLSSDHHAALVLARRLERASASGDAALVGAVSQAMEAALEDHFRIEEEVLLPALREAGELEMVARVEVDHRLLRAEAAGARAGDLAAAAGLAERLREHVRFEERELFPRCEVVLPGAVLDEVARRAPKPG
jgi:hemerythrin-like domain-containing protein